MIQLNNVSKRFYDNILFEHVNLTINECGIHAFVGESGCGKSTLLNMLAGYEKTDEGSIEVQGKSAFIFQNYELVDELNVHDNIYLPLMIAEDGMAADKKDILESLGLIELMEYYPKELSGGQKQRVGIARALFMEPDIIFCDEPTESLDQANKEIVLNLLKKLSKKSIVILVTHDQKIVENYADCIYHIDQKNIIIQQKKSLPSFKAKMKENQLNTKNIAGVIHKIIHRRTVLYSLLLGLLVSGWVLLFGFNAWMFKEPSTTQVLNKDIVYVTTLKSGFPYDKIDADENDVQVILPFTSVQIRNEYYKSYIVPFVSNNGNLPIKGKAPVGPEVIVNQLVAEKYGDDILGETIILHYTVNWTKETLPVKVVGIIEEADAPEEVIYYDISWLQDQLMNLMDRNNHPQWEVLEDSASYFQLEIQYENIDELKTALAHESSIKIENPLFDARMAIRQQHQAYMTVFLIAEILLTLAIFILTIVYAYLDTKNYMKTCAILVTMGCLTEQIKDIYFKQKIKIFGLFVCGAFILSVVLWHIIAQEFFFSSAQGIVILLFIVLLLCLFAGILQFLLRRLRPTEINRVIKEM